MNAKTAAALIGIALLAAGMLGFFANPVFSPTGFFVVTPAQNVVHLSSGLLLLLGAYSSLGAEMALKIVGVVYALIAILVLTMGPMLLGLAAMHATVYWLQVALAVVILAAGFVLGDEATA